MANVDYAFQNVPTYSRPYSNILQTVFCISYICTAYEKFFWPLRHSKHDNHTNQVHVSNFTFDFHDSVLNPLHESPLNNAARRYSLNL